MTLKKIMRFFCGRSLEKETAKTNALILKVELHEKTAMERLKGRADDYRAQVDAYKKQRDADLKEFIAFMNKQVGLAEGYVPHLGDFQDKMFVSFDSWMNTSLAEQKVQLLSERITTKCHMRDFITALQVELNKLTQRNERNEWRNMIKERPFLVSSTFIERTARQVSDNQKSSSKSIRDDLSRLKSHSKTLQTEIKELRHERDRLIASSRELIERHKVHKVELNDHFRKCSELFDAIKDRFSDHFGSAATESRLVNNWIAEIEGMVTIPKLIIAHRRTAYFQNEVEDEFNDLSKSFQEIRTKIDENRKSGDYSTLNEDKATRDKLFRKRQEVGERRHEIKVARKVFYVRINEVKDMLDKFALLQPDESIRRIVEIFRMGKDFDLHRAIGVRIREDRYKHYEFKNQRR